MLRSFRRLVRAFLHTEAGNCPIAFRLRLLAPSALGCQFLLRRRKRSPDSLILGISMTAGLILRETLMGQFGSKIANRIPRFHQRPIRFLKCGGLHAQRLSGSIQLLNERVPVLAVHNGDRHVAITHEVPPLWVCTGRYVLRGWRLRYLVLEPECAPHLSFGSSQPVLIWSRFCHYLLYLDSDA
jgi:hypothetical protein